MSKKSRIQLDDIIWKIPEYILELSEGLLFNATSAIFQLYPGENTLIFNEMMRSTLY